VCARHYDSRSNEGRPLFDKSEGHCLERDYGWPHPGVTVDEVLDRRYLGSCGIARAGSVCVPDRVRPVAHGDKYNFGARTPRVAVEPDTVHRPHFAVFQSFVSLVDNVKQHDRT
jgi:hypothetical protein